MKVNKIWFSASCCKAGLALAAIMVAAGMAGADDSIILGTPIYGGTGCPDGTAQVQVSPAQDAISVLFDQFVTQAGASENKRVDRQACSLSIPVQVPQGFSVAIFQTDYRGFNLLPAGGLNRINTTYFFAGQQGPTFSKNFVGPLNSDYEQSNGVLAAGLVWAPCGESVNLRINSSIMTMTNANLDEAMMTVDSADVSSTMIFHIQWRQCQ